MGTPTSRDAINIAGKQQFRKRMEWLEAVAGDAALSGGEARCALLIGLKYVNSRTGKAYPAFPTLAKGLKISERHAYNCIRGLISRGWLQVHKKGGGRKSNVYILTHREGGKVIPFQLSSREQ